MKNLRLTAGLEARTRPLMPVLSGNFVVAYGHFRVKCIFMAFLWFSGTTGTSGDKIANFFIRRLMVTNAYL